MGGLGKLLSGWTLAPLLVGVLSVGILWVGLPLLLLLPVAAVFAFLMILQHSPSAINARRLALAGVGLAWMVAPFSGLKLVAGIAVPEILLAFAAMVAWLPPRRRMRPQEALRCKPIGYVLLIVLGGIIGTVVEGGGFGSAVYLARLVIAGVGSMFILRRFDPTESELRLLTAAWAGGALLSAAYGLTGVAASGRSIGLTGHSNQLSMMCAMAIPLVMVLASRAGFASNERPSANIRFAMVGALGILLLATILSGSRSGILAVGVVLVLITYRYLGMAIAATIGVLSLAALLISGLPQAIVSGEAVTSDNAAIARLSSGEDTTSSNDERGDLLSNQVESLAGGSALWGKGFGVGELGLRSHNVWLEVWGGAGLLGLIGMIKLTFPIFRDTFRRRKDVHPMVVALAVGFVGYLAAMTFNNAFDLPYAWTFYALWERWGSVASPDADTTETPSEPPKTKTTG